MQRTQIHNSSIEKFSTLRMVLMPTVIEEIRSVVSLKYEFEYRENPKLFSPLELSSYQNDYAKEKSNDFSAEYSFTTIRFPIEVLMEELELVVAKN